MPGYSAGNDSYSNGNGYCSGGLSGQAPVKAKFSEPCQNQFGCAKIGFYCRPNGPRKRDSRVTKKEFALGDNVFLFSTLRVETSLVFVIATTFKSWIG